jgi:HD superfamily phosphodiesterase
MAAATMRSLLAGDPSRRRHSSGVAARAVRLSTELAADDRKALVAAAWLHDIGHALSAQCTGLHALDGAHHLVGQFPRRTVSLVAHHSGARFEADLRGLTLELGAFEEERSLVADLLTYCDMTVGPNGERTGLASRVAEVENRYGADHLVARALHRARPELQRAVDTVEVELLRQRPAHRSAAGPPAR